MTAAEGFTPVQLDTLRELMNIGFGKAAVALSGIADCRIMLKVPEVRILELSEITRTINSGAGTQKACFAVEQTFSGRFSGSALLYIPGSHIDTLVDGYIPEQARPVEDTRKQLLENDTAAETGNIVMESCTGTLADLLDCRVSFQPPRLVDPETGPALVAAGIEQEGSAGILCRTAYGFGQDEVPGFLFLALSGASLDWLQVALDKYLANLA
jgi:chemotaxis protein CheC